MSSSTPAAASASAVHDRLDDVRRQLKTARKQLSRVPKDAEPEAKQRAADKVARLEKLRDDLYTGEQGIGRRKKVHREAEREYEAATGHIQRGLAMVQSGLARLNEAHSEVSSVAASSLIHAESSNALHAW